MLGCGGKNRTELHSQPPPEVDAGPSSTAPDWVQILDAPAQALMSVHGTTAGDVWMVGADAGQGPLVQHFDGSASGPSQWTTHDTGTRGDIWWVQALSQTSVYFSGANGLVLHYDGQQFERMATPGLGKDIVFGLWAASDSDIYAVGASLGRNGFLWHYDGQDWQTLPLPDNIALDANSDTPNFFKVWGQSPDKVWVVGDRGVVLTGNAEAGFELFESGVDAKLFTVHATSNRLSIVGGSTNGVLLDVVDPKVEPEAAADPGEAQTHSPEGAGILQGLWLSEQGDDWAVGIGGTTYRRRAQLSQTDNPWERYASPVNVQSLHAVWVDPQGGAWSVGGNVLNTNLDGGVALYTGSGNVSPTLIPARTDTVGQQCPDEDVDPAATRSIARRWNEQLLSAIRRAQPRPTVHARNLLHTSIALWDAWSAYDELADGYVLQQRIQSESIAADREIALSYAAYRVLAHRYASAVQGEVSLNCFDGLMTLLDLDPAENTTEGNSPIAVGNRVGAAVIAAFADDGANEANGYADPEEYQPPPPRLVVDQSGTRTDTPTIWQQLDITEAITQNGIAEGSGVREYVGAHWSDVRPFALIRATADALYFEGENPPTTLDDALVAGAVTVIAKAAELDLSEGTLWDISPGALGNNPLGEDSGTGHSLNPSTGEPYAEQRVLRGDFTRVLAEFWADGPSSETPPGHWNTLANKIADSEAFARQLYGEGPELDALQWDVKTYLALNGAVHDAAIAAWELKRNHVSARPITLIRYMAARGQRTDPEGPSYNSEGLPLVDNLIEVITAASSAPGQRHAHLARYAGEVALWSWRGEPGDRDRRLGGVGWIRGVDWRPYQRSFFVTPAFPGYVSGHSTFSRAAAVVLHQLTGDEFFPGGIGSYRLEPGYLFFEYGPSAPIELQWATYYDAADQAGQSRLWGGIHIPTDDYAGRKVGQSIGELAVARARTFYEGTAIP